MSEDKDKELDLQNSEETVEEEVTDNKPEEPKKKAKKKESTEDIELFKKAVAEAEIERIRKEEKDKLYPSLEKYKEDARKAEEARKTAEAKLQEYETSKLTAEEQAVLKLTQLEESNEELQKQMQSLVEEANSKISALQLELTKKEVLAQYGDEIIPSLVFGATIEEIMESAEKSHSEYLAIREREIAKLKAETKSKPQIGAGINPQSDRLNVGVTVADINKIDDPQIWKANRDKFLEEALKRR